MIGYSKETGLKLQRESTRTLSNSYGPLDYVPIYCHNIETGELVISKRDEPDVTLKKREWTLSEWARHLFFNESIPTQRKIYHYKDPIEMHRIQNVRSYGTEETTEGVYYVRYE